VKRIWDIDELKEHCSLRFEETDGSKPSPPEITCHLLFSLSFIRTQDVSFDNQ
jgi:hypothetical protein